MGKFKINDRVVYKGPDTIINGVRGTIACVCDKTGIYQVAFDNLDVLYVAEASLEPIPTIPYQTLYKRPYFNYLQLPKVKKIIYSGPKTIVLWDDGTKTVVGLGEGEEFDEYAGFCAAVAKKAFGSKHQIEKIIKDAVKDKED